MAWTARHCFPSLEAVELWKPQAAASHPFHSTSSHKETKVHIIFSCSRGNGECSWGHPRSCHQRYVIYSRPSACLKRRDDFDVVTCLNWGIRNLETGIMRYHGNYMALDDYCLLSEANTSKLLGFYMAGWKYLVHLDTSTMIAIFVNWRLFHDLESNQGLEVRYCV